jgi:hypothetical protein
MAHTNHYPFPYYQGVKGYTWIYNMVLIHNSTLKSSTITERFLRFKTVRYIAVRYKILRFKKMVKHYKMVLFATVLISRKNTYA